MDTMITHFTEKEKKRKNIHTNEKGDTVMTLEETERARNLLK
jgi:hypothetical protein